MILEGDDIRLRPFRELDIPVFTTALNDWAVAQWLERTPYPYDDAAAQAWLAHVTADHASGHPGTFAIAATKDDVLVGGISVVDEKSVAILGYWLKPQAWGRGIATRAARLIVAYAFEDLQVSHLAARTDIDNQASGRVLTKVGFRCLGERAIDTPTRRDNYKVLSYELTAAEWQPPADD